MKIYSSITDLIGRTPLLHLKGYEKAHYEDVRLPMALQAYEAWGK